MKEENKYDIIVLDAMLYYASGDPQEDTFDEDLLEKLDELKRLYPNAKNVLVFGGSESCKKWRETQSNMAFNRGWISYFCEGEKASKCIHMLTTLVNVDRLRALVFTSSIDDLTWVTESIDMVTVDEDGDLCRWWNLPRFVEAFGFEPGYLPVINALQGWDKHDPIVPEERIQLHVQEFRNGKPLVYGTRDFSQELEERLQLLESGEPSPADLNALRKFISVETKEEGAAHGC